MQIEGVFRQVLGTSSVSNDDSKKKKKRLGAH